MISHLNLLDTSISTDNLGDIIIVDSIRNQLADILSQQYVTNVSTHDSMGAVGRRLCREADINMLLGTNALTSKNRVGKKDMWRLRLWDISSLANKVVLCGVGWRNYQTEVKTRQAKFYRNILNGEYIHSVRDSHAESMLKSIGINNVLNTTCPTTWSLNQNHCATIPQGQAPNVVFTLTRHKKADEDKQMIRYLLSLYNNVYFWPQQIEDTDYLKTLVDASTFTDIHLLAPSLLAFDLFLQTTDTDFIGTRLHGGIRALQLKRRSFIIGIDNRAREIAKDINLPVLLRQEIENLPQLISSNYETAIKLPIENITKWRNQDKFLYKKTA
ncbi:polysaccharide pyruvyl transferase family protein [Psychrosphaera sp. 1_MG-2023]|uniref:polysaccharide pyruvyl transferase family protein n=1 Tax=Psychrosphaera sp. 1_MG-2023 TaxID=3062643 RepID=UPI0026E41804|nr:polysaccharide pyruvyl transferase family protein [Psychrosphaera sp. 1_MG-2023]MDO6719346.1 polysaccharide pyruvyl transferase family protein [Psychrosphaera sp. 1_MG-2023]